MYDSRMVRLSLRSTLSAAGFALLEAWQPGVGTEELLDLIGEPAALGGGRAVHRLIPEPSDPLRANTYSGAYGLGPFPLHTDLAHWRTPPRYFLLRCVVGFKEVPTLVLDGADVVAQIEEELLMRALMQPRRPIEGQRSLFRLYEPEDGLLRWDERYIVPATARGRAGAQIFREALDRSDIKPLPLFRAGDTLVIDNWRMLHGRAPVPEECRSRVIERAYLASVYT